LFVVFHAEKCFLQGFLQKNAIAQWLADVASRITEPSAHPVFQLRREKQKHGFQAPIC